MDINLPNWPYAFGGPSGTGEIKSRADDFVVEEILAFTPEGAGEHVFLYIEKSGENTEFVARQLARHANVRQRDVSYAGLKDRHGRTRQWFSVWLPGKSDPDWSSIESENLQVLQSIRHARKLKRGVLAGNEFSLVIRNVQADRETIEQQLQLINIQGFPNYFGEQRFGHNGQNINRAVAMFQGAKIKREQRSIYLSAARSYLFNLILAKRVNAGTWNKALPGDVFKLGHTNSHFRAESIDQLLLERLQSGDIHPTGALYGKGDSGVAGEVLVLEQEVFSSLPEITEGLLKADLETDRRALRAMPEGLRWEFSDDNLLQLWFRLSAGCYATALLREIISVV